MIIRRIPHSENRVYLTFDDGPDPIGTPRVLNVLQRLRIPATFFVVAHKLDRHPELVERIRAEGHAFGDHSLDHRYRVFMQGHGPMRDWLEGSRAIFRRKKIATVGFRPPAGVVTPVLKEVLSQTERRLILWDQRFFDTVLPWSRARALSSIARLRPGSIILLHDRQSLRRIDGFCEVLAEWSERVRDRGFEFATLPRESSRP